MKPKISVIMSVFNGELYVEQCIESVISQTFEDFEFLILDDASTDRTNEIIKKNKDKRIKLIKNEKNLGLTKSLNLLIEMARGEYVARLDADDICMNERFQKQKTFLDQNKSIGMVASNCDIINENSDLLYNHCPQSNDTAFKWSFLFRNPIRHSTAMMRKEVLNKIGKYNESFEFSQDYELWNRIKNHSAIAVIPETLARIRVHEKSISNSMIEKQCYFADIVSKEQIEYHLKKSISLEEIKKLKLIYFYKNPIQINEIKNEIEEFDKIIKLYFELATNFQSQCKEPDILISEVALDIKSLLKISRSMPNLKKIIKFFLKHNDNVLSKKIWNNICAKII